jgi:ATP-binding cassette subfamily C protein
MIKRLYSLLSKCERRQLHVLLVIMVFGALLDAISVAVFFPFIALLKNPDYISQYPALELQLQNLGIDGSQQIIILFAILLIVFFVFKNLFLIYMNYRQYRFTFRSQVNLANRLYQKYIYSPYEFHIQNNSSKLYRNLRENSLWVFNSILYPMITVVTETFVVIFILSILMYISPVVTSYVVLGFITIGAIFNTSIKSKSKYYGKRQQNSLINMNLWINQGLHGIKEIKLRQNEPYFFTHFSKYTYQYASNNIYAKTIDALPKPILETLLIVGIAIAVILVVNTGNDFIELLPTIALFAFAAIRLMPSANRIMTALGGIKFFKQSLNNIYAEFENNTKNLTNTITTDSITPLTFHNRITLKDISYQYAGTNQTQLNGLSLVINKGDFIGIAGSTGCGKSTLVDVLTGLLKPQAGGVYIDDTIINENNIPQWRQYIGYIPQSVYFLDDSIKHNIAFGVEEKDINVDKINQVLKRTDLYDHIYSLENDINTSIGENGVKLSGGQKQRLGIARALYFDSEILILDETTSALDATTEEKVMNTIKSLTTSKTIIMITHRLSTIKAADYIFFMAKGRIKSTGTFDQLCKTNQEFSQMANEAFNSH